MRNNNPSFQLVTNTIQNINIPGRERISVKMKTNNNLPGQGFDSFEKKDKTAPLSNAFNNAVEIQMVKLKNIDLISFIF